MEKGRDLDMKIGMNLLLWTGAAGEAEIPLFRKIKKWGFDGVELPMFSPDGSPWAKLAQALDKLKLDRSVVTVLPQGANLISGNDGERQAAADHLRACVDSCVALGANLLAGPICSPVGRLVGRGPTDEEFDWAVEGLKKVGAYAKTKGVTIAVEGLNRFETYFPNSQEQLGKLTDAVGNASVGQMYDTFHANIEEKNIAKAVKLGGKRIKHVHISANDRATPGEDHVQWKETFSALKAIKYDGWLTIEAFGKRLPDLAAATCIWRKMYPSEDHLAREGCKFVKRMWRKK